MKEFSLPVIDLNATLEDAASEMRSAGVSGVVVHHGNEYRLLHLDDIARAGWGHKKSAGEVESFTRLRAIASPALANQTFIDSSSRYLVTTTPSIGSGRTVVSVISKSEDWAAMFLSPPHIRTCQNQPPHHYPPNVATAGAKICVVCGLPLNF